MRPFRGVGESRWGSESLVEASRCGDGRVPPADTASATLQGEDLNLGEESDMRLSYLLIACVVTSSGLAVAPTAGADCTSANGTTICSQGESRGSDTGDGPSGAGPYVPYPCGYDWYCNGNTWGVNLLVDPGPPGIGLPGPPGNRPGGGPANRPGGGSGNRPGGGRG
ncbi:MAG: hypothetical protein K0U69_02480 [Actinomycetia bacterium]|nr:hypothetical protein [Actinomycetes bacterium]